MNYLYVTKAYGLRGGMISISISPTSFRTADNSARLTPLPRPPFATTKLCREMHRKIIMHTVVFESVTQLYVGKFYKKLKYVRYGKCDL